MKKTATLFLVMFVYPALIGCPACVGTIQQNSPPFFAEEFYEPYQQPLNVQQPGENLSE